jgi:hypothetical protein
MQLNVLADVIGEEVLLAQPLEDISLGGCRFAGPAWEPKGGPIHLVLNFPASGANVSIDGTIVRASDEDMGVRFQAITEEQKWALRKHIREAQQ